jgi:hypothetical protein
MSYKNYKSPHVFDGVRPLSPERTQELRERLAKTHSLVPAIASELYKALERLNAPPDLLSIVGSYGDTLDDSEILELLKAYNETGEILNDRQ